MKTKIIYISGNEIFDMADIRAAFEEVRTALNLDKSTVLFGVPVDADDAGLNTATTSVESVIQDKEPVAISEEIPEIIDEIPTAEQIVEQPKKRGRPRKETVVEIEEPVVQEVIEKPINEEIIPEEEKIVPILSVLSSDDTIKDNVKTNETEPNIETQSEIIAETTSEIPEDTPEIIDGDDEADLEKLLSAMTPLQEDIAVEQLGEDEEIVAPEIEEDISVDATLEQLATEFAETQDKINAETKSSTRSKIGKLRNILPFKQSKHKDDTFGDLFNWAGVAANDEDFSVPGFFTNAASKK